MAIALAGTTAGTNFASTRSPQPALPRATMNSGEVLLMIVTIAAVDSFTTPSGWTIIGTKQDAGTDSCTAIWRRVCDGSETSPITFTNLIASAQSGQVVMIAYSGVDNTSPINTSNQTTTSASGTITGPSISPSVDGCLILHILACDPANNSYETTPDASPAATQEYDASAGGNTAAYTFIQSYQQTTAAAITLDAGGAENDDWANFQIALTPAASSGTSHPYSGSVGVGAITLGSSTVKARGKSPRTGGSTSFSSSTVKARGKAPVTGGSSVYGSAAVYSKSTFSGNAYNYVGAGGYALFAGSIYAKQLRWYLATSLTITDGAISSGTLANTKADDGVELVLTEIAGTPGYTYDFTFGENEPVVGDRIFLHLRGYYQGNTAHNVKAYQYNYTTTNWDALTANTTDFKSAASEQRYQFVLYTTASYLSSGQMKVRVQHTSAGNPSHLLHIDDLHLSTTGDFNYEGDGSRVYTAYTEKSRGKSPVSGGSISRSSGTVKARGKSPITGGTVAFSAGSAYYNATLYIYAGGGSEVYGAASVYGKTSGTAGTAYNYVGQGVIVFSGGARLSIGRVYESGGAFHFDAGTIHTRTKAYTYSGLPYGTIVYAGATVYVNVPFSAGISVTTEAKPGVRPVSNEGLPGNVPGLEAKPGSRPASKEGLPALPAGSDGAWTIPDYDGAVTEPPVDGAYTDIGYFKEFKPWWQNYAKENKPN